MRRVSRSLPRPHSRRHLACGVNSIWLLITGVAVIAMHALVDITMNLGFPQHQWSFFLYAVNLPFWILKGILRLPLGMRRHPA
jgi:hypothetical protein